MTTIAPGRHRVPRRVLVAGALLLLLAGSIVTSLAIYTGVTQTVGSSLAVGTVDISAAPAVVGLDASAMTPGRVIAAPLTVRNDGSLALRYSLTSTVTGVSLADVLEFEVRVGVSDCSVDGASLTGTLLAGPVRLGGVSGDLVLGDPTTGADPGDRALAAGGSEVLCFRVELPPSVDENTAAGLTTAATLRLDAEQTAANP